MLRIGIFSDTYYPTINGVSASTLYFSKELAKLGHHVFIFCPRYNGSRNEVSDPDKPGFSVFRCPSLPLPMNREHAISLPMFSFNVNIRKLKMDIIHIQAPFILGVYGTWISQRFHLPLTQTYHTMWEHYSHYYILPESFTKPVMAFQNTHLCNLSAVNFVPSPQVKESLLEYGVKTPIILCPTGIDTEGLANDMNEELVKNHLGIPADKKILLFASRMCEEKSVDTVVDAFEIIIKTCPDVVLVLTGDGPYKNKIHQKVKKQGLDDKVIIKGYLSRRDLHAHYKASDIFIFPSVSETQGLVVLEAQFYGKPVVGVSRMGVKMILEGNNGGLLAENKDAREIAALTIKLLTDEKLYAEKSKQAAINASKWRTSDFVHIMENEFKALVKK
ncbi:MAG: glycosyltransferase [Spirochaetales bacterium]|nr:glycosyltransferase [Spirochaetales bacterium]